ncbi:unnamed protein product, partial [marine sediment metagenome]
AQAIDIGGGWVLKLKQTIELPKSIEPLQNGGNGNGENGGSENNEEANPLVLPVIVIVICLIAVIAFVKVKSK